MKSPSSFLLIGIVLLCIALGAGLYVWYEVQKLDKKIGETETSIERIKDEQELVPNIEDVRTEKAQTENLQEVQDAREVASTPTTTVVDLTNLTDTQRDIVRAFGVSGDSFEVTQEMLECARKAVENERFTEIINGSAPTPLESMKLLPCFVK